MEEIIVKSQAELDAIPIDFDGQIIIKFGAPYNRAIISRRFKHSVVACENSSVVARGNSSVEAMENSSVVACENSSVVARGNSSVVAWGNTQVVCCNDEHNIAVSGNARIVYNPKNITEYLDHYGIPQSDGTVKLYKAVHKRNDRYFSDKMGDFEYAIGEVAIADSLTADPTVDCGHGIHISSTESAVYFGKEWLDLAILEVEADISSIIVPLNGSGKVRTDKVLVLREVPLEECGLLGKIIAKKKTCGIKKSASR